jgi:hypothetical protein
VEREAFANALEYVLHEVNLGAFWREAPQSPLTSPTSPSTSVTAWLLQRCSSMLSSWVGWFRVFMLLHSCAAPAGAVLMETSSLLDE